MSLSRISRPLSVMFGLARLSSLALALAGVTTLQGVSAATIPIPDHDPFYQPPSGFASKAPGTVLKSRASSSGTAGISATQILYRTSGGESTR